MKRISHWVITHRRTVLLVFIVLSLLSALAATQVKINYNLTDFLPENVPSSEAIKELEDQYTFSIPNARAAFAVSSIQDALIIKEKLSATEGIEQVLWLDDSMDIATPLELADQDTVDSFYKDGQALFQLTTDMENAATVLERIYAIDPDVRVDGQLVSLASAQNAVQSEIFSISIIILPLALVVLAIGTRSWLDPFLFLITIGVGIILNMGTNLMFGQISFITQAVAAVLQLAVSIDYTIFLLNRFNENLDRGDDSETAMAKAMVKASTAISSSALTTLFGFLALIFMRFRIGSDLGTVMAKGIVCSYLSVMLFMPVLTLSLYKWIEKTQHRSLMPDFTFLGKFSLKGRYLLVVLALILAIPGYLGSRNNTFIYGMGAYPEGSKPMVDEEMMRDTFGEQQQLSLLVPKGEIPKEIALQKALKEDPDVLSVISYVGTVDKAIPSEVLDQEQLSMLISKKYSQFIITAEVPPEGQKAFDMAERVRNVAAASYGDDYYLTGYNVVMLDMKTTIEADDFVVNVLAVLAIALVILLAFRSISLPIILVLTIEIAIWINLSFPYFIGYSLSYIGYLIISTVQLGATVDYAILYTEHYLDNRKKYLKDRALVKTSRDSIPSLLPPAFILACAGIALDKTSSLTIVSELGEVLGRGAILSFILVTFVLPGLLYIFDRIIEKTTKNLTFVSEKTEKGI